MFSEWVYIYNCMSTYQLISVYSKGLKKSMTFLSFSLLMQSRDDVSRFGIRREINNNIVEHVRFLTYEPGTLHTEVHFGLELQVH